MLNQLSDWTLSVCRRTTAALLEASAAEGIMRGLFWATEVDRLRAIDAEIILRHSSEVAEFGVDVERELAGES